MKYAFLFFACLSSTVLIHAQIHNSAADQNRIKITVSHDNISIAFKDKAVIVHSNQALDSCLQKAILGLDHPAILIEAPNDMDPEKSRAIAVILEKFHCPIMSFLKLETVNPPATRRQDTVGH